MAVDIQTLEQRIKERAYNESCIEAQVAINAIPRFNDFKYSVEIKAPTKDAPWASVIHEVVLDSSKLKLAMQRAIQDYIYVRRVNELSQKLLSAVDQIEELSAAVDNIQAQG